MPILIVSAAIATPPGIGRNATTERNTTMIPNTVFTFFFMPLPPFFPRECTRPDAEKPTSRFLYYRHIVLCCQEEKRPPAKRNPFGRRFLPDFLPDLLRKRLREHDSGQDQFVDVFGDFADRKGPLRAVPDEHPVDHSEHQETDDLRVDVFPDLLRLDPGNDDAVEHRLREVPFFHHPLEGIPGIMVDLRDENLDVRLVILDDFRLGPDPAEQVVPRFRIGLDDAVQFRKQGIHEFVVDRGEKILLFFDVIIKPPLGQPCRLGDLVNGSGVISLPHEEAHGGAYDLLMAVLLAVTQGRLPLNIPTGRISPLYNNFLICRQCSGMARVIRPLNGATTTLASRPCLAKASSRADSIDFW